MNSLKWGQYFPSSLNLTDLQGLCTNAAAMSSNDYRQGKWKLQCEFEKILVDINLTHIDSLSHYFDLLNVNIRITIIFFSFLHFNEL